MERQEAAGNGANSCLVKAFQCSKVNNAKKRNPSG